MTPFAFSASFYDALYDQKDYAGESAFAIDRLESALGYRPVSIADLGCGTGRHAECFARSGIRVTALDICAEMLAQARVRTAGLPVELILADIADPPDLSRCDGVVSLFHVLGYLALPGRLEEGLVRLRRRLPAGTPLLFDYWNSVAVMMHGCEVRERSVAWCGSGRIIRTAVPRATEHSDVVRIEFRYRAYDESGMLVADTAEEHDMRHLSPGRIADILRHAGFALRETAAWGTRGPPDANAWNAYALATAD